MTRTDSYANRLRKAAAALALGGLLALGACGGGDEPSEPDAEAPQIVEPSPRDAAAAKSRDRQRQRAAEAAREAAPFEYIRYSVDTSGNQPEACFVFSHALDPERDYSPFVELRPASPPALSVDGRALCLGGLSFGSGRVAILKSGLPAANGKVLAETEDVPVDFSDRPAFVGFKGAGVILPREDADGLPIETVNVDSVEVTVSRVNDRALAFKSITQGTSTPEGGYSYIYGDANPGDVAVELWRGSMPVASEPNAPVTTVFPIGDVVGELEPGAYFVEVRDEAEPADGESASSQRWILLTDLALTAYRGEGGMDVFLRSLFDGQELSGQTIQLVAANNDVLAEAKTDATGRVSFDAPVLSGEGSARPKLVLAFGADGDLAALDLTRAPVELDADAVSGRAVRGPVDAFLYTDRGIYRPGETVHLTQLLRSRTGRASDRASQLVIYRPNGVEAERFRFTDDDYDAGGAAVSLSLPASASRGSWRAVTEVDGAGTAGSVSFQVEDFVPQRVALDLDRVGSGPVLAGETAELGANARFLYGAPGAGLTVKALARIQADPNPFPDYDGFVFGRHDQSVRERLVDAEDSTTDGAGDALIRIDPLDARLTTEKPLRINTVVSVLEPGGRAVSESERIPYRPERSYAGIRPGFEGRLAEGEPARFDVVTLDPVGEPLSSRLLWQIVEIDFHYDWYRDGSGQWRYRRSRTVTVANEGRVRTGDGPAAIEAGQLGWGRHELILREGREIVASHAFNVGWGGGTGDDGVEAPDRVQVSVPDAPVEPGREAEIVIVPPYDGEAQIVVATDRILSTEIRAVSASGTRITLPVSESWGEGAYVMVTVYTPRNPVMRGKPRRAVGVGYVEADTEDRTFRVNFEADAVLRPGERQMIEVELEDRPRESVYMTVAAVDEGILRLTKFQTPDPAAHYFGRKALGVDLYDDYGRLLDPNLGLPAEVRTGGDGLGGEGLTVVPVESVALWSGVIDVPRNGRVRLPLDIPPFNGELRVMAVAWSETAVGSGDTAVTVRDKAPADLVLPRFLAPGDRADIVASIDNVELPSGRFEASFNAEGPASFAATEATANVRRGERSDLPVTLRASAEEGISRLTYSVEGPEGEATQRSYQLQSRSPWLPVTEIRRDQLSRGEAIAVSADDLDGFVPGSVDVTVSFSSLPVDPGLLYASLSRYPYGCTEQAVSRAQPLLYASQLVALAGDDRTAPAGSDAARQERSAQLRVQETISTLLQRQSRDGAFGLWREADGNASPWLGAYTTDFLFRAQDAGYAVPNAALDAAYRAMGPVASGEAWRVYGYDTSVPGTDYHNDSQEKLMLRSQAYAMYVLAKAGRIDVSRLRYLHDRRLDDIDSPLARAQLAAGLAALGDRARANSAFEAALDAAGYINGGDYYQTPLRDRAGMLALAAEAGFDDVVRAMSEAVAEEAPDPAILTTQEKAFLLLATEALTGGDPGGLRIDAKGIRGVDNERQVQLTEAQARNGASFELRSDRPVFASVFVRGTPDSAPPAISERMELTKVYYALDGARTDLSDVRQGDQIVVSIEVDDEERRLNPLIIEDLLPAGFEIETVLRPADGARDRGDEGAFAWLGKIDRPKAAEARDDRFIAAIDLMEGDAQLAYIVRAVTPGDFALPGTYGEDMYRPEMRARTEAGRVTIQSRTPVIGGDR